MIYSRVVPFFVSQVRNRLNDSFWEERPEGDWDQDSQKEGSGSG